MEKNQHFHTFSFSVPLQSINTLYSYLQEREGQKGKGKKKEKEKRQINTFCIYKLKYKLEWTE